MDDSSVLDENTDFFFSAVLENFQLPQGSSPQTGEPLMLNQIQGQPGTLLNPTLPSSSRSPNVQMDQFAEAVITGTQPLAVQQSQLGVMQSSFPSPSSRGPGQQIGQECPQFQNPQFAGVNATMPPLVSSVVGQGWEMMQNSYLSPSSRGRNPRIQQEYPQLGRPRFAGIVQPIYFVTCVGPLSPSARDLLQQLAKEMKVEFYQGVPSVHILSPQQAEPSNANPNPRVLHLDFEGNLPETVFTQDKIRKGLLKLVLRDIDGSLVEEGPESCAWVRLRLLDGGFAGDHRTDWSRQEFESSEVKPRKDKAPLLIGTTEIRLDKGIAEITDIACSDISSKLTTNEAFRLGAELVGGGAREAVSKPFKVKVNRLKSRNQGPRSLEDSPSCLKYIKETNRLKLAEANIRSVKDLLQLYYTDAGKLQEILHTSEKKLLETVKSAESCPLTKEYYLYKDETAGVRLILDCVFNVKAACFRDQTFKAYHVLDDSKKKLVSGVRFQAYLMRKQLRSTDQRRTTWISVRAIFVFFKVAPKDSFEQHPGPAKRQRCYWY